MKFIKIKVEDVPANRSDDIEPGYKRIGYDEREDGWYVNTNTIDGQEGRRRFAAPSAKERDLRQLLKKEYDIRY